jgi:hypothetical protein
MFFFCSRSAVAEVVPSRELLTLGTALDAPSDVASSWPFGKPDARAIGWRANEFDAGGFQGYFEGQRSR